MNNQAPPAAFNFRDYSIPDFQFRKSDEPSPNYSVFFNPKGEISRENGIFTIVLEVVIFDNEKHESPIISLTVVSDFEFNTKPLIEVPEYFYRNSVAIVFPYIRAFISTLSQLANHGPHILPLLNLTKIANELQENTTDLVK